MGIVAWIVLGLLAGILARWVMPGKDPMGLIITILLGIAGAFVGGWLAGLLNLSAGVHDFSLQSLLVATAGAFVLLGAYRLLKKT